MQKWQCIRTEWDEVWEFGMFIIITIMGRRHEVM